MMETMSGQGATEEDIQHHYDVGDDFYRIWLDPEMVYTCAMYETGDDLQSAQMRKLDYHIAQARAAGAKRVLDVGCGWWAAMRRAVNHHNTQRITGITLSKEQASYIRNLSEDDDRIDVELQPWQEFEGTDYDSLLAIGVLEHVADTNADHNAKLELYRRFFGFCNRALRPGAYMSLQTIAYGPNMPRGKIDPFIANTIFPGSDLPNLEQIAAASNGLLHIRQLRNDAKDYASTCSTWADNIEKNMESAVAASTPETVKNYIRYLRMSSAGFLTGALYLFRITFQKQG